MCDLILHSARTEVIAVLTPSLYLSRRAPPPPTHAVPAGNLSDGTPQFILPAKQGGG